MGRDINLKLITITLYIIIIVLICSIIYLGSYIYITANKREETAIAEVINEEKVIEAKLPEESNIEEVYVVSIKPPEPNIEPNIETAYSNRFYYNQLDNYSKMIYDALDKNKNSLRTGTAKIVLSKELAKYLTTDEGKEKVEAIYTVAVNAFECDNPSLFYVDFNKMMLYYQSDSYGNVAAYLKNDETRGTYLTEGFTGIEDIENAESNINTIIEEIQENTSLFNEYYKVKYVHDWIVKNTKYDRTLIRTNRNNIYGVLIEKEATCGGYAKTFKYIMDKLNINSIVVQGEAFRENGESEYHAWNYVELNQNWYLVDNTWDDPIVEGVSEENKRIYYNYFLKNEESFSDHKKFDTFFGTDLIITYPEISQYNY